MSIKAFLVLALAILSFESFAQILARCSLGRPHESFSIGSFSIFHPISSDLKIEDSTCFARGRAFAESLLAQNLDNCSETMLEAYEESKHRISVAVKMPAQCFQIGQHFARTSIVQGARLGHYHLTTPKCMEGFNDARYDSRTGSGYNRTLSNIYDYCYNAARFESLPPYREY